MLTTADIWELTLIQASPMAVACPISNLPIALHKITSCLIPLIVVALKWFYIISCIGFELFSFLFFTLVLAFSTLLFKDIGIGEGEMDSLCTNKSLKFSLPLKTLRWRIKPEGSSAKDDTPLTNCTYQTT